MKKKTVFFGPFVGEFGWELFFWHGWVRRLCRTRYKDYRKIACSFPGRHPFYPEVDEFRPLPEEFLKLPISPRNYIADCWIGGKPEASISNSLSDVWPRLGKVIEDFRKKLPEDTEFIHPWTYRYDKEDKRYYGVDGNYNPYAPPRSKQILEKLKATKEGKEKLRKMVSPGEKLIAIFPRRKLFRRPDKNWSKENYETLIKLIQKELPEYKVAVLGDPSEAFFGEGVPENCIDLINIDPNLRMDIQLAALKHSELSLGGQSGGLCFAMASGSQVLIWGLPNAIRGFSQENYMKSPFVFLPYSHPSADLVFKYVKWILGPGKMPLNNIFRVSKINFYRFFNPHYLHIIKSRLIKT